MLFPCFIIFNEDGLKLYSEGVLIEWHEKGFSSGGFVNEGREQRGGMVGGGGLKNRVGVRSEEGIYQLLSFECAPFFVGELKGKRFGPGTVGVGNLWFYQI